jgi:hypothetical protein
MQVLRYQINEISLSLIVLLLLILLHRLIVIVSKMKIQVEMMSERSWKNVIVMMGLSVQMLNEQAVLLIHLTGLRI